MSLVYFYGPDTYGAREEIRRLAQQQKAEIRWIGKEELAEQSWSEIAGQQRGLFGRDLVVVRDPSQMSKDVQEEIIAYLTAGRGEAILWDRLEPDKRSRLFKAGKVSGREFAFLPKQALVAWLGQEASSQKGHIDTEAANYLIDNLGYDRWRLRSELERLLLVELRVTLALAKREVAARGAEAQIFLALDALVRGNKATVIKHIERLLEDGEGEFYILSMLAYQFRTLFLIRSGQEKGLTLSDISQQSGLHPYAVEKSASTARQFPVAWWREGLTRIMATDFAIKRGKVQARTALIMLVLNLASLPVKERELLYN